MANLKFPFIVLTVSFVVMVASGFASLLLKLKIYRILPKFGPEIHRRLIWFWVWKGIFWLSPEKLLRRLDAEELIGNEELVGKLRSYGRARWVGVIAATINLVALVSLILMFFGVIG